MTNKKLEQLQQKIDLLTKTTIDKDRRKADNNIMNIAIEVVSGIVAGLIAGTIFDKLFDSKPIFLIICIICGMIASFRILWKKL